MITSLLNDEVGELKHTINDVALLMKCLNLILRKCMYKAKIDAHNPISRHIADLYATFLNQLTSYISLL